jgi:hypothetical protein
MEDPFWNTFLQQLDGTHTQEDLAQFLVAKAGKTIEEALRLTPDALREVAGNRLLMR